MRSLPFLVSGLMFLAPFVDPRRPFRVMHLDLLVLLLVGCGPLAVHVGLKQPPGSAALAVLGLVYLAARFLHIGFRPPQTRDRLVPLLTTRWLTVALVVVIGARFAYATAFDPPPVGDVGGATIEGADRIAKGEELYDPRLDRGSSQHHDTYGPFTYIAYIPFEQALPWAGGTYGEPGYDAPVAARVAALTFDAIALACLFVLGGTLRRGTQGRLLGLALAYAWASYPYSIFEIRYSFNNTLVAVLVLGAFLTLTRPAARGALAALATLTKFAPALLAPLFATGTGERRGRSWILFSAAFLAVTFLVLLPLQPPGG